MPPRSETLEGLRSANRYFMNKWPNVEERLFRDEPSNSWPRAVYHEGLMALYAVDPLPEYYGYAVAWAEHHGWAFRDQATTRDADDQCAGQTYIELYELEQVGARIRNVTSSIDEMMATERIDDWHWIDAIHMAMPVFSRLGRVYDDPAYFDRMHAMYDHARNLEGGRGLFNPEDGFWWRDKNFQPPYREPNGEDCYWSRGNGWVVAGLVRVLQDLPEDEPHRELYLDDLKTMLEAAVDVQREDGFWNPSLHDPDNYGGPETTGTALFTYALAWSLNNGLLNRSTYYPALVKAWNALLYGALHSTGFLGYVQDVGRQPSSAQPVTYDKMPEYEDFGLGCFLLAGSEVYQVK